jgi:hypothetical protein
MKIKNDTSFLYFFDCENRNNLVQKEDLKKFARSLTGFLVLSWKVEIRAEESGGKPKKEKQNGLRYNEGTS